METETKICSGCKKGFPATNEYFLNGCYKRKDGIRNFRAMCKKCIHIRARKHRQKPEIKEKNQKYKRECYQQRPYIRAKVREAHQKTRYGLTPKQRKDMYIKQNGCCYICRFPIPYESINTDHNHTTNKVRKLLCQRCNTFVGWIEKSPELVIPILDYLEEHKV